MKMSSGAERLSESKENEEQDVSERAIRLDAIFNRFEGDEVQEMTMGFGRSLQINRTEAEGRNHLMIKSPQGLVELEVTLTEKGPVLHFNTADLQISSSGKIVFDCDMFHVHANQEIRQESHGNLTNEVAGDLKMNAKQDVDIRGRVCQFKATRGDVKIEANDDVRAKGERIRLNC